MPITKYQKQTDLTADKQEIKIASEKVFSLAILLHNQMKEISNND